MNFTDDELETISTALAFASMNANLNANLNAKARAIYWAITHDQIRRCEKDSKKQQIALNAYVRQSFDRSDSD